MDAMRMRPAPSTFDDLAAALRERRAAAGSPSFTEITRRVAVLRAQRGVPARDRAPGRVTIYDCFREGRRRVDVDLVLDITEALGAEEAELRLWRDWCVGLLGVAAPVSLVAAAELSPGGDEEFSGREALLGELQHVGRPIAIAGMAGAGKTMLARRLLRQMLADGRITRAVEVSVRGSEPRNHGVREADVLAAIARAVGMTSRAKAADADVADAVVETLAETGTGVLVDDIAEAGQVRQLLRAATVPVVLTSRRRLEHEVKVAAVPLSPWGVEEALDYLRQVVGSQAVDEEPDAARDLIELTGRLPLAVALTASRVAEQRAWSLQDHRDALQRRIAVHQLDSAVRESVALSYGALDSAAQRALRLLAVQPCTTLSLRSFAALTGTTAEEAAQLARRLTESHCAQSSGAQRLSVHALMKVFAASESWEQDAPSWREEAIDRLAAELIAGAHAAVESVYPGHRLSVRAGTTIREGVPQSEAGAWLANEIDGIIELSDAIGERRPQDAIAIAEAVARYLDRQGLLLLLAPLHQRALQRAEAIGDEEGIARALLGRGQVRLRLGKKDAVSLLETAAEAARTADLPRVALAAHNALAVAAAHGGDFHRSLEWLESGLATARENGFVEMLPVFIDNTAVALSRVGDLPTAAERHQQSYEMALEVGDFSLAATAIGNLSEVQLLLGDPAAALASGRRAMELTAKGAPEPHVYAITNVGLALRELGDLEGAVAHQERALVVALEMADAVLEAAVRNNLGVALVGVDDVRAEHELEAALDTARTHGIRFEIGRALVELAGLDVGREDYVQAGERVQEALEVLPDADILERRRAHELREAIRRSVSERGSRLAP